MEKEKSSQLQKWEAKKMPIKRAVCNTGCGVLTCVEYLGRAEKRKSKTLRI